MTGVDEVMALEQAPPKAPPAGRPPAPGGLGRVQAFVNTIDLESGTDELDRPEALATWLVDHGLPGGDCSLGDGDLARARAVREAVREILGGNAGHAVDPGAIALLDDTAVAAPLAVTFGLGARPTLVPAGRGLDAALGALLADIATAVADGTWTRLKTCRNDACRWAYWDGSKNRSGAWCTMAVCGNRMKGRAYRRRRRADAGDTGSD